MPRKTDNLFVCVSQYKVPLDEVQKHVPAHREWLDEQNAAGRMIASGRMASGAGGVLVMTAADEPEMRRIVAGDPFDIHGCAAYWIFEFKLNPDPALMGELMRHFFGVSLDVKTI